MREFEIARTQLATIERESTEKTKRSLKKFISRLARHPDFPTELSNREGPVKGFLLYTMVDNLSRALFVTSEGLFYSFCDLELRPSVRLEEAPASMYQKYARDVIVRLKANFDHRADLRNRLRAGERAFGLQ